MAVDLYFANIGSGKSTYIAKLAYKERKRINKSKSKYKFIISNVRVEGAIYEPDIRKILKQYCIMHTLLLIDEASIVYNNRLQKITEKEIEFFKLSRHAYTDVKVFSQSHDDVDVTLRRLYRNIYLMNDIGNHITTIKPILKRISIDEIQKCIIDEYYKAPFFMYRAFFRYPYYKRFDSFWLPEHLEILDIENYYKGHVDVVQYSIKDKIILLNKSVKKFYLPIKDRFSNI